MAKLITDEEEKEIEKLLANVNRLVEEYRHVQAERDLLQSEINACLSPWQHENIVYELQQENARLKEAIDSASDLLRHDHSAYKLLQRALATEGDKE